MTSKHRLRRLLPLTLTAMLVGLVAGPLPLRRAGAAR